ncbi:TPA: hypothetical protein MIO28_24870 [Klebsiella pneumoniae subsp. pneumoniae]|nr:hypothetical protein [Klebsiella pneumoniae subsp. pneumoniae]HBZ1111650.1 hypothetical protein [Klebsiella pneumoniae]
MQKVHAFARIKLACSGNAQPELTRIQSDHATALKPTPKAGRRGGESTARQRTFAHLFSQPERVAVPRGFAGVSVDGAGMSEGVAGF